MGIPRLRQLLEPYAEQVDLKGRDIIIDGPGLAYHVLHDDFKPATSLFTLPTYTDLGQAAVRWLDQLTKSGANVAAIYFDGYLPSAKEPERKKRFLDLSKGLRTYFSLYPSGVPRGNSTSNRSLAGSKKLPTPSFLVPSVLEAICASERYAPITKLVPGEADIFCARHVSSSGGMIITSDSDLLAHDLGQDGSVAFFPSISITSHLGHVTVNVSEYSPSRICERLSIAQDKGLSPIAFQVSIDPQVTLQRAIQFAKQQANLHTEVSEHASFLVQYLSPEVIENVSLDPVSGYLLDPRISEIVLKFLLSARPVSEELIGDDVSGVNVDIPMYLPFLTDSPARTSGWDISTSLRVLAYGICRSLTARSISTVVEYRRLQTLPGGTRVELPSPSTLDQLCGELVDDLGKIRTCLTEPNLKWTVLAMHHDISWSKAQGRGSVLTLDMLQAEVNASLDITSWDFLHLYAQVQGIYYSLRMIQQLFDFVARDHPLPDHVSELRREIGRLSLLNDFPSISEFALQLGKLRTGVDLPKLVADLELGNEVAARVHLILNPKEKKRKRSKKGGTQQGSPARTGRPSNNPFALLGGG